MNVSNAIKIPMEFDAIQGAVQFAETAQESGSSEFASCLKNQFAQQTANPDAQIPEPDETDLSELAKVPGLHGTSVNRAKDEDGEKDEIVFENSVQGYSDVVNFAEVPSFAPAAESATKSEESEISAQVVQVQENPTVLKTDDAQTTVNTADSASIARPEGNGNEVTYNTQSKPTIGGNPEILPTEEGAIQPVPTVSDETATVLTSKNADSTQVQGTAQVQAQPETQRAEIPVVQVQETQNEQPVTGSVQQWQQTTVQSAETAQSNETAVQAQAQIYQTQTLNSQQPVTQAQVQGAQHETAQPVQAETAQGEKIVQFELPKPIVQAEISAKQETVNSVRGQATVSEKAEPVQTQTAFQAAATVPETAGGELPAKTVVAQVGEAIVEKLEELFAVVNPEKAETGSAVQEPTKTVGTANTETKPETALGQIATEAVDVITPAQVAQAIVKAKAAQSATVTQTTQVFTQVTQVSQVSEFKIILRPEHLGEVVIRLSSEGSKISLVITTATAQARDILLMRESSLRVLVEITGVTITRYEVVTEEGVKASYLDPKENEQNQGENAEQSDTQENSEEDGEVSFAEIVNEMQQLMAAS
jgi:flagellar hook-length control protein FliK